jgi:hypothetical protein
MSERNLEVVRFALETWIVRWQGYVDVAEALAAGGL